MRVRSQKAQHFAWTDRGLRAVRKTNTDSPSAEPAWRQGPVSVSVSG